MYWWILKRGLNYNMLYQTCSILDCLISLGLYSLSGKTSCRQISWGLEAARFDVKMFISLWNLTGISAALLPRCLTHFWAIGKSEILNLAASKVRSALPRIIQLILFDMIDVYLKDFKSKVFISHTHSKTTHPPHTHTHTWVAHVSNWLSYYNNSWLLYHWSVRYHRYLYGSCSCGCVRLLTGS